MSNLKKYQELKFNIPIGYIVITILSLFFGGITYYLEVFRKVSFIINIIIIISVLLFIFVIITIYSIIIYKKLLKKYNILIYELNIANDNRETLSKLVDNKNYEIDHLKQVNNQLSSNLNLLNFIVEKVIKIEPQIIKQSLEVQKKELSENEREI